MQMNWLLSFIFSVALIFYSNADNDNDSDDMQKARNILATEYFEHGNFLLIENNKIQDSIPFFRAATRLNPANYEHWEKLGTVELLNGQDKLAVRRFKRALSLNESCISCLATIAQIAIAEKGNSKVVTMSSLATPDANFDSSRPFILKNAALKLNLNISAFQISLLLHSEYHLELTETYPQNMRSKPSRFYTMTLAEASKYIKFPEMAFASVDASESGMYVQWNMNASKFQKILNSGKMHNNSECNVDSSAESTSCGWSSSHHENVLNVSNDNHAFSDVSVEEYLGFPNFQNLFVDDCMGSEEKVDLFSRNMHWSMMLFGDQDAGMFFHVDHLPTSSWQLQVTGRKQWKLCPPIESLSEEQMKNALKLSNVQVNSSHDFQDDDLDESLSADNLDRKKHDSDIAIDNLDVESLRELMNDLFQSFDFFESDDVTSSSIADNNANNIIQCFEGIVEVGDLVYYPSGWWHQTRNLDDFNAAISRSMVNIQDIPVFSQVMQHECVHVKVDEDVASLDDRFLIRSERYDFNSDICSLIIGRCVHHWESISTKN